MKKVAALRQMPSVPFGTYGKVIDKYEYFDRRYIVVEFDNGVRMDFGEESHPLISYKGWLKPL